MSNEGPPSWQEAAKTTDYQTQYQAFCAYFDDYTQWFATKSQFARYVMKLGLYLLSYAGILFCFNGFSGKIPKDENAALGFLLCFALMPLILLLIAALTDDADKDKRKAQYGNEMWLIKLILPLVLYLPLILHYAQSQWEYAISPIFMVGLSTTLISYMVNRLEGYTRAWSRYRTAHFKIQLNHCEWAAERLDDRQAQLRLLNIVNDEIEDRHRDIIADFHFFGDSFASLIRKK